MSDPSTIKGMLYRAIRFASRRSPRQMLRLVQFLFLWIRSSQRRRYMLRARNRVAPQILIFSPTMACNLACPQCYSREYPHDNELSMERIDRLFAEAKELGTFAVVITGGEPFMRPGLIELLARHIELLFFVFSNGALIDDLAVRKMARAGNIIPVLSLEGDEALTDRRRGPGAYRQVVQLMRNMQSSGLFFGCSTMVTTHNTDLIAGPSFFSDLSQLGCWIVFLIEYVPTGQDANPALVLTATHRAQMQSGVETARNESGMLLFQLPDDAHDGKDCGAAGRFLHINSVGDVDPCPFVRVSPVSIRNQSLVDAVQSPFFEAIRNNPRLLTRGHSGCALVEKLDELRRLAHRHVQDTLVEGAHRNL